MLGGSLPTAVISDKYRSAAAMPAIAYPPRPMHSETCTGSSVQKWAVCVIKQQGPCDKIPRDACKKQIIAFDYIIIAFDYTVKACDYIIIGYD